MLKDKLLKNNLLKLIFKIAFRLKKRAISTSKTIETIIKINIIETIRIKKTIERNSNSNSKKKSNLTKIKTITIKSRKLLKQQFTNIILFSSL